LSRALGTVIANRRLHAVHRVRGGQIGSTDTGSHYERELSYNALATARSLLLSLCAREIARFVSAARAILRLSPLAPASRSRQSRVRVHRSPLASIDRLVTVNERVTAQGAQGANERVANEQCVTRPVHCKQRERERERVARPVRRFARSTQRAGHRNTPLSLSLALGRHSP